MPQIKEYNQRVESSGPIATRPANSEDFGGSIGAGIAKLGEGVQDFAGMLKKRNDQAELSDATVELSETHAAFTNQLNDGIQKGNLNTEDLMQKYDDQVADIGTRYGSTAAQQYIQKSSAQLKSHFLTSAVQGQAQLAGEKSKQDYISTLNNNSSSLMKDPSSYSVVKENSNLYLDSLVQNGSLPAEAAMKLKAAGQTELAKAATRGWIDLNPEDAKKQLESGKWDTEIDGDVKKQLLGEADMGIRGKEIEKQRIEMQAKQALEAKQKVTQKDFLAKIEDGSLSVKDILKSNLDPFGSGGQETFLRMLDTHNKEKIQTDPKVLNDVFDRIHLPDGDPNKIVDENELNKYFGNGLDMSDLKNMRAEMQGKGTIQGKADSLLKTQMMNYAKNKLTRSNPMLGIKDPDGDANLATFTSWYSDEYQKQIKQGKTSKQLLDPSSPDYLGKYVDNYAKTPQEIMKALAQSGRAKTPLALPDGSIPGKPQEEKVRVKDKNGRAGFVPKSQLKDALASGYSEVK